MKLTFAFFGVASLALAVTAADAATMKTEASQVRALEDRFAAAVRAKDLDGIMKVYAPDVFVFDLVPPRQYVGAAAYRKDWEALITGYKGPITFEITDLSAEVDGNTAFGHSIQRLAGTTTKGRQVDMTVRVTDVYRKLKGEWRVVQEHVSVPLDLDTMKPDMASRP